MGRRAKSNPIWSMPTEQFHKLVDESETSSDVLKVFGLPNQGRNNRTLWDRMLEEGINAAPIKARTSKRRISLCGNLHKLSNPSPDLSQVLIEHSTYSRGSLKRRLIEEGILKKECALCLIGPEWNGNPLVLRLDHISGVGDDNRLPNLRLLCPNCDSQLPTFCGRNKAKADSVKVYFCNKCGDKTAGVSRLCPVCLVFTPSKSKNQFSGKVNWPDLRVLDEVAKSGQQAALAKNLGVSPAAVSLHRKRLREAEKKYIEAALKKERKPYVRLAPPSDRAVGRSRKVDWLPLRQLNDLVKSQGYLATGRLLGVSDNAVRKMLQRMNKNIPGETEVF